MTRELDIEIARLDGCNPGVLGRCRCKDRRHEVAGEFEYEPISYSSDLNALMELIRRRWPEAVVEMGPDAAIIWKGWPSQHATLANSLGHSETGDTDAERLAHAVRDALRAEQP